MTTQHVDVSRIHRKQSLHASVIKACRNCGAPGYWHNTPGVNVGCYAPDKVTNLGSVEDYVGTICPNCGAKRDEIDHKGEIWSKVWRTSLWSAIKGELSDAIARWRKK